MRLSRSQTGCTSLHLVHELAVHIKRMCVRVALQTSSYRTPHHSRPCTAYHDTSSRQNTTSNISVAPISATLHAAATMVHMHTRDYLALHTTNAKGPRQQPPPLQYLHYHQHCATTTTTTTRTSSSSLPTHFTPLEHHHQLRLPPPKRTTKRTCCSG